MGKTTSHIDIGNGGVRVTYADAAEQREPLVDPRVDLRDFAFMPLDVRRLRDSDLAATSSSDAFRSAVLLWCAAWHQIPAASLPQDDTILAALAGYGRGAASLEAWLAVKAVALRGFVPCSDGRLYHPVIAEKAVEAWRRKGEMQEARRSNAERVAEYRRRRQQRNDTVHARDTHMSELRNDGRSGIGTEHVTRLIGQGQGQGQGHIGIERANALSPSSEFENDVNVDAPATQPSKKSRYSAAFLAFWVAYPRKVGKDAALRAWRDAKLRHGPDAVQIIQANAEALAASSKGMDERWIPHPSTWLNEGRFLDPQQQTAKAVASWRDNPLNRMVNPAGG